MTNVGRQEKEGTGNSCRRQKEKGKRCIPVSSGGKEEAREHISCPSASWERGRKKGGKAK